jgi:hypothetical protein
MSSEGFTEIGAAMTSPVFGWVQTDHGRAFAANPSTDDENTMPLRRKSSSSLTDNEKE